MHNHDHDGECISCNRDPAEVDAEFDRTIEKYGHFIIGVFGDRLMAYSVGRWEKNSPEFIILGMNSEKAAITINLVLSHVATKGPVHVGDVLDDIANVPVKIGAVDTHHISENFRTAIERAVRANVPLESVYALQIIWPDTAGRFPDDPLFEERFVEQQPLLSAPAMGVRQ